MHQVLPLQQMDISTDSEFLEHQNSLGCSCLQCQAMSLLLRYVDTEKGEEHVVNAEIITNIF